MNPTPPSHAGPTGHKLQQVRRLIAERLLRQTEGLALYRGLPLQDLFHLSPCQQRLVRGSNRSGKTICAAVEVARAVTGQDPYGKYPKEDGRCYAVGKGLDHVGQVMARKLLRPGAFRIVRDPATGHWRPFRPWDPADQPLKEKTKPAPPLIPKRLIKAIAWEGKAKGIPKIVTLVNGWELSFYSSEGKPPQGADLDMVWFDEEITDEEWYPEMRLRLVDRQGVFLWSATPQAGTDKLFELHERALLEARHKKPSVQEYVLLLRDNPFISAEDKRALEMDLNEDQRLVRIEGEFALHGRRVYPEWHLDVHTVPWREIPSSWTRYVFIDPGRRLAAALFVAVPPKMGEEEGDGDYYYLYDELYLPKCSANLLAQRLKEKSQGQTFEAFLIDIHGARQTEMGSGLSIEVQYSLAFRKHGVSSVRTGNGFLPCGGEAYRNVEAGVEAFRELLRPRDGREPKLRVLRDRHDPTKTALAGFEFEIKRYRYKTIKGIIQDKPEEHGQVHQMANARYLALFRPRWVSPKKGAARRSGALGALRAKQERMRKKEGDRPLVNLGPGVKS